jgi:hypothetical protein
MKTLIIFNRNQENLNLLIDSLEKNVLGNNDIVIFDQNRILQKDNFNYPVISVDNLKNQMITLIKEDLNSNYTIIDENKFCYDKFNLDDIDNILNKEEEIFCFSLSLGKNITFCSNMNCDNVFIPIKENNNIIYWDWSVHYMDFGYPLNLDGTVYRGKELIKFIKNINFENSLELENGLQIFDNYPKNIMCCFNKNKFIEIIFDNKEKISKFNINDLKIDRTKFIIKVKDNEIIDQISN